MIILLSRFERTRRRKGKVVESKEIDSSSIVTYFCLDLFSAENKNSSSRNSSLFPSKIRIRIHLSTPRSLHSLIDSFHFENRPPFPGFGEQFLNSKERSTPPRGGGGLSSVGKILILGRNEDAGNSRM